MSTTQVTPIASFHVPLEVIEQYTDWTECVAFRFRKVNDETYLFEVSSDLDKITAPDCDACTGKGYVVQVGPANQSAHIECRACGGTGRAGS